MKVDGDRHSQKGGRVGRGHDKSIYGNCTIYSPGGINQHLTDSLWKYLCLKVTASFLPPQNQAMIRRWGLFPFGEGGIKVGPRECALRRKKMAGHWQHRVLLALRHWPGCANGWVGFKSYRSWPWDCAKRELQLGFRFFFGFRIRKKNGSRWENSGWVSPGRVDEVNPYYFFFSGSRPLS